MSTQLDKIANKAKQNPQLRFTSLSHLISPDFLIETWKEMNQRGSPGVDGETMEAFNQDLESNINRLYLKLRAGKYQAPPVRRVDIPKGNGGTRPLGIPYIVTLAHIFSMIFWV